MSTEDLERRVQVLEDVEAIKQLKARYCLACDDNFNVNALMDLFAEDAIWEGDNLGLHQGREAIRDFYRGITSLLTFAIHYVTNPVIDVEGDRARGSWYLLEPGTRRNEEALWIVGRYDDEYARIDGRWLFKRVNLKILIRSPYEDGWVKNRLG